jgi:hypothetical protein
MILGSKLLLRSRGVSISISPKSPRIVGLHPLDDTAKRSHEAIRCKKLVALCVVSTEFRQLRKRKQALLESNLPGILSRKLIPMSGWSAQRSSRECPDQDIGIDFHIP